MSTERETYKGFLIKRTSIGWSSYDASGQFFELGKTKAALKGFISAYVNGEQWALDEARRFGYRPA